MDYYINPQALSYAFTVPTEIVDRHLKLARGEHIKVLLYIFRNMSAEVKPEDIAKAVDIELYDVNEALLYWADAGILLPKTGAKLTKTEKPKTVKRSEKPDRNDVAKRGAEDEKIRFLLGETQLRFGRNLKTNETSTLVWLYDDEGLDISIILMIIQYAVAHGKANMRFIESTAVDWINKGIDNITAADDELRKITLSEQSWHVVENAFGIERRKPSKKESELALLWIDEWSLSPEMLSAAYEACVDVKSKLSIPYVAKILESWHKKGYKSPDDIIKKEKRKEKSDYAAYDIDLFEKMLDSKD